MRAPRLPQQCAALRVVLLCAAVSAAASACSSNAQGSGDVSLAVTMSQDEITVENLTGTSLSKGEVAIIPMGFARPYLANLSYMASGSKRSLPLTSFRMSDGSPFRREVTNGKSVKVTAKDVSGKAYEREVPFK
jgi:hypothetical protein